MRARSRRHAHCYTMENNAFDKYFSKHIVTPIDRHTVNGVQYVRQIEKRGEKGGYGL